MAHLPAPIAAVRSALRDFLTSRQDAGLLSEGDLLLVACSGGADSVALAAQLAFLAPRMGYTGGLVTVDHRMQRGSAEQAQRVARLGEGLGLGPVRVHTANEYSRSASDASLGPEGTARELRYAALRHAADLTGAQAVLLGHTMEDQAETVLLGLSRGAGTRAVAGMPETRGVFWRPILTVRRQDTEGACDLLDLPVWEDPTNAPDGPWRTAAGRALPRAALRHRVIPELARALGQDPVPALARTAALARQDSDFLEQAAGEHFHLITAHPEGGAQQPPPGAVVSADVEDTSKLPAALRWRVLRELILRAGAPEAQVGMGHVHGVDSLLIAWRGQLGISLPGGLRAHRSYGRLYVVNPSHLEHT